MRRKVVFGLMAVLAIVAGVSLYNIIKIHMDNQKVDKTYGQMQNQYVTDRPTPTAAPDETPAPTQEPIPTDTPAQPQPEPTSPIVVDFEGLKIANDDVVGWLYSEGTYINYPVVQARDNNKYLRKDLYGNYLISGTLFVDFRNRPLGQDKNYIIYGHNMKTDRMFGSLVNYKDQSYYEAHRTLWYLTPEGDYMIEPVAGRIVDEQEILYAPNPDSVTYGQFLQETQNNSTFDSGISLAETDKLLILSTCSQENVSTRYVLFCRYSLIEE